MKVVCPYCEYYGKYTTNNDQRVFTIKCINCAKHFIVELKVKIRKIGKHGI